MKVAWGNGEVDRWSFISISKQYLDSAFLRKLLREDPWQRTYAALLVAAMPGMGKWPWHDFSPEAVEDLHVFYDAVYPSCPGVTDGSR